MSITQYLNQINHVWNSRMGNQLADLLSLRDSHVTNRNLMIESPHNVVGNFMNEYLYDVVAPHIRCIWFMSRGDWAGVFSEQTNVVQAILRIFGGPANWMLPVLLTTCSELRLAAARLDREPSAPNSVNNSSIVTRPREPMEKAAENLMAAFRICSSDNRSSEYDTKKWGTLSLVNQLMKLYFRISKLHLMKPLIRTVDLSSLKDRFPLSQQVTYKYFVGRKAMYDSQYTLANEYLTFAFERCHKQCVKNKRLILIYLVPVKILLGWLPSRKLLEKYDLLQLWEIREAVRLGSPLMLTKAMEKHQEFFIKCGIYLILERLRFITYRNLFKKVYLVCGNPLALGDLVVALHLHDSEDAEIEEATCILANLIHQSKIKGYISHSHQKLVLSKADPFPKLTATA